MREAAVPGVIFALASEPAPPLLAVRLPDEAWGGERSLLMERRLAVDEGCDEEEWLRGGCATLGVDEKARRIELDGCAMRRALDWGSRGGIVGSIVSCVGSR